VEEIDFQIDLGHLRQRMTAAERHLIERLWRFLPRRLHCLHNLVISLYRHITRRKHACTFRGNCSKKRCTSVLPHAARQLRADQDRRAQAFAAIENIPSIRRKRSSVSAGPMTSSASSAPNRKRQAALPAQPDLLSLLYRRTLLLRAFAYVYSCAHAVCCPPRSRHELVFRDESAHMAFASQCSKTVRREEPQLFMLGGPAQVRTMIEEASSGETAFAEDVLSGGVVV